MGKQTTFSWSVKPSPCQQARSTYRINHPSWTYADQLTYHIRLGYMSRSPYISLATLVLIICSAAILLSADDDIRTGRYINGNAWVVPDDRGKIMYVTAFKRAARLAQVNWMTTARVKPSMDELHRQWDYFNSDGEFTADDILQQIDKFCADKSDRVIAVPYAIIYVTKKFRGASSKELNLFKERLRQEARTTPPISET